MVRLKIVSQNLNQFRLLKNKGGFMADEKGGSLGNSIGAFWKQTTRDGQKTYLSGSVQLTPTSEKIKVIVFANKNKPEGSKQPDFRMYRSNPQKKEASEG